MPKGSRKTANARREEIINACAALYETMGFKDITIRDIGKETTFTRTSIYTYFQTKEEIFLALLQREHEAWLSDIEAISDGNDNLTAEEFADALAGSLSKRGCMLKLMSMNIYDMEINSRMENLVSFKKAYADVLKALTVCLEKFFPEKSSEEVRKFLYIFFPFLFGVYPYTTATKKQKEAMEIANIDYPRFSPYELIRSFVIKML